MHLQISLMGMVIFMCLLHGKSSLSGISYLTLCMLGNFSKRFCLLIFFSKLTVPKILSGLLSECQTAWIQIQTVCKGYQQTTLEGLEVRLGVPLVKAIVVEFQVEFSLQKSVRWDSIKKNIKKITKFYSNCARIF